MSNIRVLVVEDEERWQQAISDALKVLSNNPQEDIKGIAVYEEAVESVKENPWDVVVVDFGLPAIRAVSGEMPGIELVREIRQSKYNKNCAVIVITANADTERVLKARDEDVFTVIDKHKFPLNLADIARSAILDSRIKKASLKKSSQYRLAVTFGQNHFLKSEVSGPNLRDDFPAPNPQIFDVDDLVRRTDTLKRLIEEGLIDSWRPEASSIGNAIYEKVMAEGKVLQHHTKAKSRTQSDEDVWWQLYCPPTGIRVPFELMRDKENEPLALNHILTRQMTSIGSGKPEQFHDFLAGLIRERKRLRILIVGANSSNDTPDAQKEEAEHLKKLIEGELYPLGINPVITLLTESGANYNKVEEALSGGDYHVFHYCGHGFHNETVAEQSGLVLLPSGSKKVMTADQIYQVAKQNKNLRLVFLNSCVGARVAEHPGRGDFHGVFEAFAKADVPIVIGYRWSVQDKPAMQLAEAFYRELWRTFLPGEAMLKARQYATREFGRDDLLWASPVMLMQNA